MIICQVTKEGYKHNLSKSKPFQEALMAYAKKTFTTNNVKAILAIYQAQRKTSFKIKEENNIVTVKCFVFNPKNPMHFSSRVFLYLYDIYVKNDSPYEINIGYAVRKTIDGLERLVRKYVESEEKSETVQDGSELYAKIWEQIEILQQEVEKVIRRDMLPRFRRWVEEKNQEKYLNTLRINNDVNAPLSSNDMMPPQAIVEDRSDDDDEEKTDNNRENRKHENEDDMTDKMINLSSECKCVFL